MGGTSCAPGFEDVAYIRLYYRDLDLTANIHVSWLDPCKVRRTTIVGSSKMAVYNDLASEERVRIHDKGVELPTDSLCDDLTQPPMIYRYGEIVAPVVEFREPLAVQDQHFIDSVVTGSRPNTDGINGLDVVAVLEAVEMSLARGGPVELAEVWSRPGSITEDLRARRAPRVVVQRVSPQGQLAAAVRGAL